jgi:hypothetical protein
MVPVVSQRSSSLSVLLMMSPRRDDAELCCADDWHVRDGSRIFNHVIPARAGNQFSLAFWVPACAGMTRTDARTTFDMILINEPRSTSVQLLYLVEPLRSADSFFF